MKFLPPDDPTAVYPIGKLKQGGETPEPAPEAGTPAPPPEPAKPLFTPTPSGAHRATPSPKHRSTGPAATHPALMLAGVGAVGMLLGALVLGLVSLAILFTQ